MRGQCCFTSAVGVVHVCSVVVKSGFEGFLSASYECFLDVGVVIVAL